MVIQPDFRLIQPLVETKIAVHRRTSPSTRRQSTNGVLLDFNFL